jgi:hypothetical protein
MRLPHALLSLTALLAACNTSGGDDTDSPVDTDSTADTDATADTDTTPNTDTPADTDTPVDTEPPLPPFTPSVATLTLDYAFDPRNQVAAPFTFDGATYPVTAVLVLANQAWQGDPADTANSCTAVWQAGGTIPRDANAPSNPAVTLSLDVTGNTTLTTDCGDRVDPAWSADIGAALAAIDLKYDLFVDLLPPWRNLLDQQGVPDATLALYTNSGLRGTLANAAGIPFLFQSITTAFEIDQAFVVQVDGQGDPVPVPQAAMFQGDMIMPAWYNAFFFLDLEQVGAALGHVADPPAPTP